MKKQIIGIFAILVISLVFVSGIAGCPKEEIEEVEIEEEEAGLYDYFEAGGLSFQLTGVTLLEWRPPLYSKRVVGGVSYEEYTMFWDFIVSNNGEEIEEVSDCGVLLFEDGSQYNLNIARDDAEVGVDITDLCGSYTLVPGAKTEMYTAFYFNTGYINPDYSGPCWWSGDPMVWEEIQGSKITYFSQQDNGLVKFIIDKSEIIYESEDYDQPTDEEAGEYVVANLLRIKEYMRAYC